MERGRAGSEGEAHLILRPIRFRAVYDVVHNLNHADGGIQSVDRECSEETLSEQCHIGLHTQDAR